MATYAEGMAHEEEISLPASPTSPDSAVNSPPLASPASSGASDPTLDHKTAPLRPVRLADRSISANAASATTAGMTSSSTPLGSLNAARRPQPVPTFSSRGLAGAYTGDIAARMKAFQLGRQGAPSTGRLPPTPGAPGGGLPLSTNVPNGVVAAGVAPSNGSVASPGGAMAGRMPPMAARPGIPTISSAPSVPHLSMGGRGGPSLAQRRAPPGRLPGGLPGTQLSGAPAGRKKPSGLTLSQMNNGPAGQESTSIESQQKSGGSLFDQYSEYVDKEKGTLKFAGKATISGQGIEFSSGSSFSISLDEVDTLDELGKGNYGTVYKVRHSRPRIRRVGMGLAGNKVQPSLLSRDPSQTSPTEPGSAASESSPTTAKGSGGTSGVVMAMKEIRLELDAAKFQAIIMELDVLHRCISPFIVDFYGAFFQEGAVYICMEFMDGGSIDKIYGDGIPENVLRKITLATTMGLKCLKDEHNIIHRDVKPTNILVNTRGQVKICDFGVSGNLVASIAKTNIGCQSYMAPERISSGGIAQAGANPGGGTYSVQSDIWSLGLTIIECALGKYPYPPETYNNIFSQLSAIVDGEPPDLPEEGFSDAARNFVRGCLNKIPKLRPTYAMLLQHAWLAPLLKPHTIMEEDEEAAEAGADTETGASPATTPEGAPVEDKEVGDWVRDALERKRSGKMGKGATPALHAAPLDAVPLDAVAGSPRVEVR